MSILNTSDLAKINSLAENYYAITAGDDYGTDEVGEILDIAELRMMAHTLYTSSGPQPITNDYFKTARWDAIRTAFGEQLMLILNRDENATKKAEVAEGSNATIDTLNAKNITACIQASEHGVFDRADSQVLFALWNHDINEDFVLNVGRTDAMMAGAATLVDWSEDSGAEIATKIVLGGVLMVGLASSSPAIAGAANAIIGVTSVLLLSHGVYTGFQAIAAEQQATNGVAEYLAMRAQGQAATEVALGAVGVYSGYRGFVKARTQPRQTAGILSNPLTPQSIVIEGGGMIIQNPPAPNTPTFSLYIAHWISKGGKDLAPLEAFIDPKSGMLMILNVGKSLFAQFEVVTPALATELLAALRTRQLLIPSSTTTRAISLSELEAALCRALGQQTPTPTSIPTVLPPQIVMPRALATGM